MTEAAGVTVGSVELIEALARRTKMRRAPNGVPATGLREAAFIPALGGFRVEMPGGAHFVWVIAGVLAEEVTFDPKAVDRLLKVLKSQAALTSEATIFVGTYGLDVHCGSAKVVIAKRREARR